MIGTMPPCAESPAEYHPAMITMTLRTEASNLRRKIHNAHQRVRRADASRPMSWSRRRWATEAGVDEGHIRSFIRSGKSMSPEKIDAVLRVAQTWKRKS